MWVCQGWYYNEGVSGVVLRTMRVCRGWYYNEGVSGVVLQ